MHALTLMREWSWEPGVMGPIVIGAIWYAVGHQRLRRRRTANRGSWYFCFGTLTLVIALVSPLDAAADEIFSAHMVQHLLLILVAAPLFVLAAPAPELWWGLPTVVRMRVARGWKQSIVAERLWRLLSAPTIVFALHAAAIWYWHFPTPYEAAERSDILHALEHLSFFGTALLFWWAVIQPHGHRRLSYALSVPYIVATMLHSGALGGLLVYAPAPWYPSHAAGAALWGLSPLEDQQLAGVIMWIPAGFVYVAAAVWAAYKWITADERMVSRARSFASLGMILVFARTAVSCTKASANTVDRYVEGGDAGRGQRTIEKYGCGACHLIPGITQANGMVGPPLIHWRQRKIIAGEIPNEPDRLIIWLEMPQAVEPGTDMPNMGLSDGEARDIAAYLYSIK
jgi:cytochrome c oxidase assembly factor CtaG/cytochrome c2